MTSASPGALTAYGWSEPVARLFASTPPGAGGRPGRVTRVERGAATVIEADGEEHPCATAVAVAVGDWAISDGRQLTGVLSRWSSLNRQDPHSGEVQVLAANVDIVVITVPAERPNPARAERELLLAWESGARPVLVLTKADLAPAGLVDELAARLAGIDVIATSAETGAGVAELAALLAPGRTGVLLGPSGAGKSRLTNALIGEDRQATGAVRVDDRRGRHTTTSRQLLALPGGGVIIDTPGLRSLGVISADHLDQAFPDIGALAAGCRFGDCAHTGEPGCAVAAAVAGGALLRVRLASYHKLADEAAGERHRDGPPPRPQPKRTAQPRAGAARRRDRGHRFDDGTGAPPGRWR